MHGTELTPSESRVIQLSILEALHDHCAQHGLTYYLAFGTLLGAVRHGGYIPWDDDIDIMMPRSDYERLRESPPNIGSHVLRGGTQESDWPFAFLKVSDSRTRIDEGTNLEANLGVNIDIFPIDGVAAGRTGVCQRTGVERLQNLMSLQAIVPRTGRTLAKRVIYAVASPIARRIPRRVLLSLLHRIAGHARQRTALSSVLVGPYQWVVDTDAFGEPVPLSFEGIPRNAPADSKLVLSKKYGPDYMQLPPVEKRITHHTFRAFLR